MIRTWSVVGSSRDVPVSKDRAGTVENPALYPGLLGALWPQLSEPVRSAHLAGPADRLRATGLFTVRHGESWLARRLVRLLGMPASAEAIETRLAVVPEGETERWDRMFGDHALSTVQRNRRGLLAEQFPLFELLFRLEAADGALVYRQVGARLRLGRLSMPLPRRLSPQVAAREEPAGTPGRTRVTVRVSLPLAGLLILYTGEIEIVET